MAAPPAAAGGRQLHQDAQALRDYITAADTTRYDLLPHGVVMVGVTHSNLTMAMPDIRLDLHTSIEGVKDKLYTHTGTKPHHQRLVLKTSSGDAVARLDDDKKMLGYYGVESGMIIHIMDEDPYSLSRNGGLEDVSKVQKYRMSDEEYNSRKGTLREWIKEQKGKDPQWQAPWNKQGESGDSSSTTVVTNQQPEGPPPGPESVQGMSVGQRCECMPGARRGTVMYLGEVEGIGEGYWVGIRFDEPLGKNDGSTRNGTRYFTCEANYGAFVRGRNVQVGDYPERDLMDDDDEEDEI